MAYDITPSYLQNPDPLGIGLQERARQYQRDLNPTGLGSINLLRNPMWDGLFQALHEAGATSLRGGTSPQGSHQLRGVPMQPEPSFSRATGEQNQGAVLGAPQSAWSQGGPSESAAMSALKGGGYQTHDEWAATKRPGQPPKVADQRGTQGMNQTQQAQRPDPNKRGY